MKDQRFEYYGIDFISSFGYNLELECDCGGGKVVQT